MTRNKKVAEYERKRLENIKRNEELLVSLNIKSTLSDLSASAFKLRQHRAGTKSYKLSSKKKVRSETPIVIRRSLRAQGKAPKKLPKLKSQVIPNEPPRELFPISMRDAITSSESDEALVSKILSVCKKSGLENGDYGKKKFRVMASIDLDSMELVPENIARVVPKRIVSVKFFPSADMSMVAVGNNLGDVGFWNVDSEDKDGDGIYIYHPHSAPVSAIVIQPFSLNKIFTCCYDGQVRSLDVQKEMFDLAYSTEHAIISMSQRPDDVNSLYIGEGHGVVHSWDERSGKTSFSWELHESRINTIDFNPENLNMMATSSTDRTVCIWDLRKLGKSKPDSLKMITCERGVQSAYFSPSGSHLATTSVDVKIGVLSGTNYDNEVMIYHNNKTGLLISAFKGIWGWDDSHIYVGNMKRGVDIISAEKRRVVTTLDSSHITAIACRFDAHPLKPGMLAGATWGGQVYIWST
uniref:WD repeat-containing protein 76-like n=1 Tax=Erigeron canadensis TaxID=72917 RepID=UPI001CB9B7D3|nr:WD repeat-containing protein 76-like [Erigeron canadensis]